MQTPAAKIQQLDCEGYLQQHRDCSLVTEADAPEVKLLGTAKHFLSPEWHALRLSAKEPEIDTIERLHRHVRMYAGSSQAAQCLC